MAQVYTDKTRVRAYESSLVGYDDTNLDRIIEGVSARMSSWLDRIISEEAVTEKVDTNGYETSIVLREWPVTLPTAIDGDLSTLATEDLTVKNHRILYKQKADERFPSLWRSGTVEVSYVGGYGPTVDLLPPAIVDAATRQVVAEAKQSDEHRIGIDSKTQQTGAQETFNTDGWLPSVIDAMRPFRRFY